MKICTKCGMTKEYSSFTKQARSADGLKHWCKPCAAAYSAQYRSDNRSRLLAQQKARWARTKVAANARRNNAYATSPEFAERIRQKTQAWREANREQHRAYTQKWGVENREYMLDRKRSYYRANRDAVQASIRKWKLENPEALRDYWHNRRAAVKAAGGRHTRAQIAELLEQQSGLCAVCEADITEKRHRDHIVALSAGGSNDIANIQLLCPDCNLSKRAKSMETFLMERRQ